ncbi:N-glycosylase/DNA lyase isoform 1-T1 [Clarias gariepinus]|uniref:N-glycosylase/DNA lyase isoform X2 n=1 Tax=Clarias gariepinus TaxID=13013 RepID=UPI00234E1029|nr:N-glycosylase/DNA lyase isoform X2 [Clarias gariepinus]
MSQHALLSLGTYGWRCLSCSKTELRLDLTLDCGQTFRRQGDLDLSDGRKRKNPDNSQRSGKKLKEIVKVKEEKEDVPSISMLTPEQDDRDEEVLRDYFQLSVKLEDLYKKWCDADPHFSRISNNFPGVRKVRLDPVECLFSFICSSNNNISRIHTMVESLCRTFGTYLCKLDDKDYYSFPSIEKLAESNVKTQLDELSFGYRANYVQKSAQEIMRSPNPDWLHSLRNRSYEEAKTDLIKLPGVGRKVADCVCLMSLDKPGAVPIDTHVRQIAKRDYGFVPEKGQKTLTDKVYNEIGNFFRELWGSHAGWAQSVLFCADLKKFQKLKEIQTIKEEKSVIVKKEED